MENISPEQLILIAASISIEITKDKSIEEINSIKTLFLLISNNLQSYIFQKQFYLSNQSNNKKEWIYYFMNIIWFFMMFFSCVILLFSSPNLIISEMLSASNSAVELIINLCGIYAIWLGLIGILEKSGLGDKLAHFLSPLIKKIFKSNDTEVNKYIAINISSNILGLGNAATPSGIKAMQKLDDKSGKITYSALMLLVINSVSIQLLPTTVIGLRENAGSMSSQDIILPTILSSFITCVFAFFLVFIIEKIKRRIRKWVYTFFLF